MTEENELEPPWKAALRKSIHGYAICSDGCGSCTESHMDAVTAIVLPHMETSYRTGRMAGATASAARLAQKNLEQAKQLREVREWSDQLDDTDRAGLLDIVGEES